MSVLADFSDLQAEMEDLQRRMEERGRELFKTGTTKLFTAFPELESFSWTQYTPYFNDGDECVFGVNDYFRITKTDGTQIGEDSYGVSAWEVKYYGPGGEGEGKYGYTYDEQDVKIAQAVSALVGGVPQETMKTIFGDHCRVIISRDRVEVEEYDHD